jgi:hypothetical protein
MGDVGDWNVGRGEGEWNVGRVEYWKVGRLRLRARL